MLLSHVRAARFKTDCYPYSPTLNEILDRNPVTVSPQSLLRDSITHLKTASCVLVVEAQRPVGILTKSDMLRLVATGMDFSQAAIAEVMTKPLVTLTISLAQTLDSAFFQQYSIQHLPIVDEQGQLLGIVTREALERHQFNQALQSTQQQLYEVLNQTLQQSKIALQQSEANFRHFAENSHQVIWIAQPDSLGNIYVSPAYEQVWGRSIQNLVNHPDIWLESVHPDDRDRVRIKLDQQRQGETSDVEYRIVRPDGSIRWIWDRGFPIRNEAGQIYSFGGIAEDITERKRAELQLREMSAALSNAVEGISRLDEQGRYIAVNDAYASMVGYTPAEMIGMNWQRTVHPDDIERLISAYQEMRQLGKVELEARGVRRDGSIFHKQLVMISAYDEQQRFIGHHCFMKDISEKKRLEAEKEELESQFLRAQRLESIGTLASGIAHDLNNILTPILAVAQLLPHKLPQLDESNRRLLEILETNAKRGGDLVKQVLSFARGTDGQHTMLQIGHLLAEISKIAQQTFPKSIQIHTNLSTSNLWLVRADITQLHQVIMNLCVNARDAMPNGGTLLISAENFEIDESFARSHLEAQVGNYVKITIVDTGTGISPEVLERIFDPFFTTKEQGRGTGLGLSTVRTIVKNHGGFIDVTTQVGQGTSFKIYLPALKLTEKPPSLPVKLLEGNNELVLIVDDEAEIRQAMKVILESHHYRVLVAEDGVEAIALYAQHYQEIDLVLLDLMMPSFDGFKLITSLPKINAQVRIAAMSGLASHQEKVIANDCVHAFLAKPFTTQDLLNTIAQVVQIQN